MEEKDREKLVENAEKASEFVRGSLSALRDAFEQTFPDQAFLVCAAIFPDAAPKVEGECMYNWACTEITRTEVAEAMLYWAQAIRFDSDDELEDWQKA